MAAGTRGGSPWLGIAAAASVECFRGSAPNLNAKTGAVLKEMKSKALELLPDVGAPGEAEKLGLELLKDKKQEPPTRLKIVQALGNAGKDAKDSKDAGAKETAR